MFTRILVILYFLFVSLGIQLSRLYSSTSMDTYSGSVPASAIHFCCLLLPFAYVCWNTVLVAIGNTSKWKELTPFFSSPMIVIVIYIVIYSFLSFVALNPGKLWPYVYFVLLLSHCLFWFFSFNGPVYKNKKQFFSDFFLGLVLTFIFVGLIPNALQGEFSIGGMRNIRTSFGYINTLTSPFLGAISCLIVLNYLVKSLRMTKCSRKDHFFPFSSAIFNATIFLVSFAALFWLNRRGPMFAFLLTAAVMPFSNFFFRYNMIYITIFLPFSFILWERIAVVFSYLSSFDIFKLLVTESLEQSLFTANARDVYWSLGLDYILNFRFQHFFGYPDLIDVFGSRFSATGIFGSRSMHNIYLQSFFDSGFIGLFFILLLLLILVKKLKELMNYSAFKTEVRIILCLYFVWLFCGTTESLASGISIFHLLIITVIIVTTLLCEKMKIEAKALL